MRIKTLVLLAALMVMALPAVPAAAEEGFTIEAFPHADADVRFSNDWGDARSGGRSHKGTDIFGPKGSPVVAVADGFIEHMEDWPRAGYALIIRHADGWSSHYFHLDNDNPGTDDGRGGPAAAFAEGLSVGDFVEAGQVVAFVGDSGNAEPSRPHTHFELHDDGRARNPFPYLDEAYERALLLIQLEAEGVPAD